MISGIQFLAFTIGSLSNMFNSLDTKEKRLLNKLALIEEFCAEKNLEKELTLKLRNALKHSSVISGSSLIEKYDILSELPLTLRYEISMAMHHGAAKNLGFFKNRDSVVVSAIVPFLSPIFINTKHFVYKHLEISDELYFIITGKVTYIAPVDYFRLYTIDKTEYFGDIEVMLKVPRKYHAHVDESAELLSLSRTIFKKISNDYQPVWTEMREVALARDKVVQKNLEETKNFKRCEKLTVIDKKFNFANLKAEQLINRMNTIQNLEPRPIDIEKKMEEMMKRVIKLEIKLNKNFEFQKKQARILKVKNLKESNDVKETKDDQEIENVEETIDTENKSFINDSFDKQMHIKI